MSSESATVRIEEQKSCMFKELTTEEGSIFYKHSETEVFVVAASIGFYRKEQKKLASKKSDLFVTMTLSKDNADKLWIMKAIAISHECSLEVIDDMRKVAEICEEYANAGIDILYEQYKNGHGIDDLSELMQNAVDDFKEDHPEENSER